MEAGGVAFGADTLEQSNGETPTFFKRAIRYLYKKGACAHGLWLYDTVTSVALYAALQDAQLFTAGEVDDAAVRSLREAIEKGSV